MIVAKDWKLRTLQPENVAQLRPESLFNLKDKVAIVTGAGGGLGAWLSAGLAAAGAKVLLTDHPRSSTQETADAIRKSGATVHEHKCDLLDSNAAENIVEAAVAHFGRVDVLVNNAGTNRREPIFEVSRQNWDLISTIDLRLPYELSRAAAKVMAGRGSEGSIIHIGSLNNAIGLEGVSVYGAHKAALCQLAKSMAVEWARHRIRVNALCPGFMLTPLSKPLWDDPQKGTWILDRSLLKRPGYPDELIGALLLLASEAGSFITGQTMYVEGGWLAGTPWSEPSCAASSSSSPSQPPGD
jgi:NAD(P)-dependent dehydrogenase (short-subunit alcohol dehydrogenase family)